MAKQREKIYRRRRPVRTLLRVLGLLVLTIVIAAVVIFFRFQRYIVYTQDGIRLDIPFLREILDEIPEDASPYPLVAPVEREPFSGIGGEEAENRPVRVEPVRTVWLSPEELAQVPDWEMALQGLDANAVLVTMNDASGMLWWNSAVPLAASYALEGEGDIQPALEAIGGGARRSALIYGFHNRLMAERNPPVALTETWLDPGAAEMQTYLTDLALELVSHGFNEIVLLDFAYPPAYRGEEEDAILLTFLTGLANQLSRAGGQLSLMTREADWLSSGEEATAFRPAFSELLGIVSRFYCILEPETISDEGRFADLMAAVEAALGQEAHRFIPGGDGRGADADNWIIVLRGDELAS